jgi:hypothetical protein
MKGRLKHIRHYIAYIIAPDMIDDLERRLSSFLENQTGGRLSKPYYSVDTMISEANDRQQRICEDCDRKPIEAEWIKTGDGITERVICSNCKSERGSFMRPPFCNQCGAKMKG